MQVHGADNDPTSVREVKAHTIGSTHFVYSRSMVTSDKKFNVRIHFDKDIRINGNMLAGGFYVMGLKPIEKNDAQVIFWKTDSDHKIGQAKLPETLRLSVRPMDGPEVSIPTIDIEEIHQRESREGRRRSRRPRPSLAKLHMHWKNQVVSLELVMTGVLWKSTPPPSMPDTIHEPWAIVHASLKGLTDQSMEKHTEHFADNFESDWDDGGSQEAHEQFIGRMLFDGAFEDSVLKLDKVEWSREADGSIQFRELKILGDFGSAALAIRVIKSEQGWKIIHLDGPKEE